MVVVEQQWQQHQTTPTGANVVTPRLRESLLSLLSRCLTSHHLRQTHALLITSGLSHDADADAVFLRRLLSLRHLSYASLLLFRAMRRRGVPPDPHTFPRLLKASAAAGTRQDASQLHAQIIRFGFCSDPFVSNSLVAAYASGRRIGPARQVFDECPVRNVVAWTAIIEGYVRNGCAVDGMGCFAEMLRASVKADAVAVVSALRAAGLGGDAWFGRSIHGAYVECGRVRWDVYVGSALVDMYSKCGHCDDAHKVLVEMPTRNVVSWTALIAGYVHCQGFEDALCVFQDMLVSDTVLPNQSTLSSVLNACAELGALGQGRWIHGYINRSKLEVNSTLGTALIDMYAKCGCIKEAFLVFKNLQVKDTFVWTAIINGMAIHGKAEFSLNLFSCMLKDGIQPNEVTFIAVLGACCHGGLVVKGRELFQLMCEVYCLEPNVKHYCCIIDLLGRAGHLKEALKLIEEMPCEPTPGILGALLMACVTHKAFELGEVVGKLLIKLQPHHSGRYALLANLYSETQNWEATALVRKLMTRKANRKTPGCSWVEVNGVNHEFISFDNSHAESTDLYVMLDVVMTQLKLSGYVQDMNMSEMDGC